MLKAFELTCYCQILIIFMHISDQDSCFNLLIKYIPTCQKISLIILEVDCVSEILRIFSKCKHNVIVWKADAIISKHSWASTGIAAVILNFLCLSIIIIILLLHSSSLTVVCMHVPQYITQNFLCCMCTWMNKLLMFSSHSSTNTSPSWIFRGVLYVL